MTPQDRSSQFFIGLLMIGAIFIAGAVTALGAVAVARLWGCGL